MNSNTSRKIKQLKKTNPEFFKSQPRKSKFPKVARRKGSGGQE